MTNVQRDLCDERFERLLSEIKEIKKEIKAQSVPWKHIVITTIMMVAALLLNNCVLQESITRNSIANASTAERSSSSFTR